MKRLLLIKWSKPHFCWRQWYLLILNAPLTRVVPFCLIYFFLPSFFLGKTGEYGGTGLCLQFLIWVYFSDGTDLKNTKSICGGIQRFLGGKGLFIVLSFHHFTSNTYLRTCDNLSAHVIHFRMTHIVNNMKDF